MNSLPLSKICTKCGIKKLHINFHLQKSAKDGLRSWCKSCRSIKIPKPFHDLPREFWRAIPDYEGFYSASNFGRIRGEDENRNYIGYRLLKPCPNADGYLNVVLYQRKKVKTFSVHLLVVRAFYGKPPKGFNTNHIDGVKTNNCLNNLEYVSYSDNVKHAFEKGLNRPRLGIESSITHLAESDVLHIRALQGKMKQCDIAKMFDISQATVSLIQVRKTWKHLG